MKAWKYCKDLVDQAEARLVIEKEEDWTMSQSQIIADAGVKVLWDSVAPGSGAPASVLAGAVQATENLGKDVTEAELILEEGFKAFAKDDFIKLSECTPRLMKALNEAPVNKEADYWKYKIYDSWEQYASDLEGTYEPTVEMKVDEYSQLVYQCWMGQICGGAFGTAIEGYTRKAIKEKFGYPDTYLKAPSTYNDDITFEIAFLKALLENGKPLTSEAIANKWVALIPFGWSAEAIALKNLSSGIYPPESGRHCNPYREWIGAQMRGAVCGMIAPGRPDLAAYYAWMDGEVSHHNNGIVGEVFNAVLTAMAFTEKEPRVLVEKAYAFLPKGGQYASIVDEVINLCKVSEHYEEALEICEKQYERYNLVHSYPNAAIEIIALWFGEGDFEKTMTIAGVAGLDVDCNTAQLGSIVTLVGRGKGLSSKWIDPINYQLKTYVRGLPTVSINEITEWTVAASKIII